MKVMDVSEVRSREHIGIVTSDASTEKFSFFVTPLKDKVGVAEGDFVVVDHPMFGQACPLLAVVDEVRNHEEVVGTTLSEKSVKTVAVGEVVGFVDLRDAEVRCLRRMFVPPNPGSKVYLPHHEFLDDVFLRNVDGVRFEHALHLGSLESCAVHQNGDARPLNFYLDAEDFTKQHFLIAGLSGVGKTHTASVIVEELANKTDMPVVILDSFGEYATVGFAGKLFEELVRSGAVPAGDYPFEFGVSILASDPEQVKRRLERREISSGKSGRISVVKGGRFSIEGFSGRWRDFPDEKAVRAIEEELRNAVKSGQVMILDGSGLGSEERRKLFSCCVSALWGSRVNQSVEPFVFVIEEAEAVEAELLGRIASEGRKFGVLMCLISQHPSEISGRVLSQMGNHMIGRMTDTEDLASLETVAREKSALLPNMRTGEWILNWVAAARPVKVTVRDRYSVSS